MSPSGSPPPRDPGKREPHDAAEKPIDSRKGRQADDNIDDLGRPLTDKDRKPLEQPFTDDEPDEKGHKGKDDETGKTGRSAGS